MMKTILNFSKPLVLLLMLVGGAFSHLSAQLSESFDNSSLPLGWLNTSSTGDTSITALWNFSGSPSYAMSGTLDHTGNSGSYAWVDGSYPNALLSILETDTVNLTGMFNPELRFWLKSDITGYTTTFNTFTVDVYDGTAWNIAAFTFSANTANQDWEQFAIPLGAFSFTGYAKFRFNVGQFGSVPYYNDIALDDVEIVSVFTNDAGLTQFLNPSLPDCVADSVLVVQLKNYGSTSLTSAQISWSINGVLQTPYSWTGSLAPGLLDMVTVDTNSSIVFGDTIDIWTSLANGVADSAAMNDSIQLVYLAGFSGVKTIDPSGSGDFISFTDAINSLTVYGVCGPVIFEAVNGTYNEQIELGSIAGVDSINTVTFRSQSGNAASVVVSYTATSPTDNYVVNFSGASYITIENLTMQAVDTAYARVLTTSTTGGNNHITINNCVLEGVLTTSGSYDMNVTYIYGPSNDNWLITNSTFLNGSFGLFFYGSYGTNNDSNTIVGNSVINPYYEGIRMNYHDNLILKNNHVKSNSTGALGYAFYLYNIKNGEINNNYVEGTTSWPKYGMYMAQIEGDLTTFLPVHNNRVYMPSGFATNGILVSGNLFVEYAFNSVYLVGDSSSVGMYLTSGGYNKVKNNIIKVTGTNAVAYGIYSSPIYQMDYNAFSAPNGYVGYNSGNYQTTLNDWIIATGFDSNSVELLNVYSDSSTLQVCTDSLYGAGVFSTAYVSPTTTDFEGEPRQNPPCIGADEFMPIAELGFDDQTLCNSDTLTLTQNYFDTVIWNMIDTSNTISISSVGVQTLQVFGACGSGVDTFNVVGQQMVSITDTNLCEGTSATLETGISNATYLWNDGSTDSTFTVDSAQIVWVSVLDTFGCTSSDTAIITQSMNVNLPDSAFYCEGDSVELDAGVAGSYLWSTNDTTPIINVSTSGNYSVTVTNQNCVSSDSVFVGEILIPIALFEDSVGGFVVVFTNQSQNFDSVYWDFGDGTTSSQENPMHIYPWTNWPDETYEVTLVVYNQCGTDTFTHVTRFEAIGIEEFEYLSNIQVYPNPNKGVFNIKIEQATSGNFNVEVVDATGRVQLRKDFGTIQGDFLQEINLNDAAAGIYFVRVILNNESAVYRIVLE